MANVSRENNAGAASGLSIRQRPPRRTKLALPTEILGLIFWHMDESTFFIALRTCRQFRGTGGTRKNLLRQVRRIPGLRLGLEDLADEDLLHECCRRANFSGCMAWVLADIRKCDLPSGTMLSKSAFSSKPSITDASGNSSISLRLALANRSGVITVYSLTVDDVRPAATLDICMPDERTASMRIHTLAFSSKGDMIVLHDKGEAAIIPDPKDEHPEDLSSSVTPCPSQVRKIYELTTFYRCSYDTGKLSVHDMPIKGLTDRRRSRIIALAGAKPVGIALACCGNASVAWVVEYRKGEDRQRIQLIRTSKRPEGDDMLENGCDIPCEFSCRLSHTSVFDLRLTAPPFLLYLPGQTLIS